MARRSGWDRLASIDWPIARAMALSGDRRAPVVAAKTLSRLGNGPIYLLILVSADRASAPRAPTAIAICGGAEHPVAALRLPVDQAIGGAAAPARLRHRLPWRAAAARPLFISQRPRDDADRGLDPDRPRRAARLAAWPGDLGGDGVGAAGGRRPFRFRRRRRDRDRRRRLWVYRLLDRDLSGRSAAGCAAAPRRAVRQIATERPHRVIAR